MNLHLLATLLVEMRKEMLLTPRVAGKASRTAANLLPLLLRSPLFTGSIFPVVGGQIVGLAIVIVVGHLSWLAIGRLKWTM